MQNPGYSVPPCNNTIEPRPPYNATNFTSESSTVHDTLVFYANNSPNYPLPTGSNSDQIKRNTQNTSFFAGFNQQLQSVKIANGTAGTIPYPQFKSESERLMYRQGLIATAARNQMTGQNPSSPAGVPCDTMYGIIYSE
jgi:hypothetical protein